MTMNDTDMTGPERYGNRRVPKMYAEINVLRQHIAREGSPNIQAAWDAVEEHIDYVYGKSAKLTADMHSPEVLALVTAAREMFEGGSRAAWNSLSAALAPFEGVK